MQFLIVNLTSSLFCLLLSVSEKQSKAVELEVALISVPINKKVSDLREDFP